ncbi:MerR family DNA-binding transcriptional regulator, partial [Enterococcus faecalis]|nr:MerR family DNA-binding transcriptional regulator [Enterococcus faecalis]
MKYSKLGGKKMISITELAKLFKTTVRTIRYYEEIGLIEQGTRIK